MKKYKIVLIGNIDSLSFGQITDETHIRDAFIELGHTVHENTSDPEILKNCDFILTFKSNRVGANHIRDWKSKTNSPVFIWSFDNMERFKFFYEIAKECDVWLGEELGRREKFHKEGLPFYYFPNHSVPPKYFKKLGVWTPEQEFEYDVIFTGTPYNDDENSKMDILKAVDENDARVRYVARPGHRLLKKVEFKVNGNPLDEYTTDEYNAHLEFKVNNYKRTGYLRNIGQEIPVTGFLTSNPTTDTFREYRLIGSGNQTFNTGKSITLDLRDHGSVQNGTVYSFRIREKRGGLDLSDWSDPVLFDLDFSPDGTFTATLSSQDPYQINLDWYKIFCYFCNSYEANRTNKTTHISGNGAL